MCHREIVFILPQGGRPVQTCDSCYFSVSVTHWITAFSAALLFCSHMFHVVCSCSWLIWLRPHYLAIPFYMFETSYIIMYSFWSWNTVFLRHLISQFTCGNVPFLLSTSLCFVEYYSHLVARCGNLIQRMPWGSERSHSRPDLSENTVSTRYSIFADWKHICQFVLAQLMLPQVMHVIVQGCVICMFAVCMITVKMLTD